ncbi:MAG: alpha/beta fold hydrolase [Janthinobacterium lividum]
MRPVIFADCFGWVHEAKSPSGRGVVLCPPLGHEALWTHKFIRALAEDFADAGIAALRFDYPSSGNSSGDELDEGRMQASQRSVQQAIDYLRKECGVSQLTLCGVRFGAALAVIGASAGHSSDAEPPMTKGVDSVVAIAPMVRGRQFVREMRMIQQGWLDRLPTPVQVAQACDPQFRLMGNRYGSDFIADISALDLSRYLASSDGVPQTALIIDSTLGDGALLAQALDARQSRVTSLPFSEMQSTMCQTVFSRLPRHAIESIVGWVAALPMTAPRESASTANAHKPEWLLDQTAQTAKQTALPTSVQSMAMAPEVVERAVQIGDRLLFGILCTPIAGGSISEAQRYATPAVLIVNTAANPSQGDGRLAVRMARCLAREGIASLRIDLDGIGDGGRKSPDEQSALMYSSAAIRDVDEMANWLVAQGYRKVVAFGVCSGAYSALQAAVHSSAIAGVIAVNLARFTWPIGMTFAEAAKEAKGGARGYYSSLKNRAKWQRAWREKRKSVRIVVSMLALALNRLHVPLAMFTEWLGIEPQVGSERAVMRTMERKGVRALLIYGTFDPGVDQLTRHFGSVRRAFSGWKNVGTRLLPELDHSLYGAAAAERVMELCEEFVLDLADRRDSLATAPAPDRFSSSRGQIKTGRASSVPGLLE